MKKKKNYGGILCGWIVNSVYNNSCGYGDSIFVNIVDLSKIII